MHIKWVYRWNVMKSKLAMYRLCARCVSRVNTWLGSDLILWDLKEYFKLKTRSPLILLFLYIWFENQRTYFWNIRMCLPHVFNYYIEIQHCIFISRWCFEICKPDWQTALTINYIDNRDLFYWVCVQFFLNIRKKN